VSPAPEINLEQTPVIITEYVDFIDFMDNVDAGELLADIPISRPYNLEHLPESQAYVGEFDINRYRPRRDLNPLWLEH
jgi:hypothetical protein